MEIDNNRIAVFQGLPVPLRAFPPGPLPLASRECMPARQRSSVTNKRRLAWSGRPLHLEGRLSPNVGSLSSADALPRTKEEAAGDLPHSHRDALVRVQVEVAGVVEQELGPAEVHEEREPDCREAGTGERRSSTHPFIITS